MRIIINTSAQRFGGGVQVALSFINECIQFPQHEYHIWVGPGLKKSIRENKFPDNFKFYYFDFGVINSFTTFKIQRTLIRFEKQIKPDVIFTTSGPAYFKSKAPQVVGYNLPLYIYPESPYIRLLPLKKRIKLNLKKLAHFYFFKRETSSYVVQTDDVNQRVRKALHTSKVYTVTNTYSSFYTEKRKYPDRLPKKFDGEIRLVTVSSYYSHKNLELIPKILNLLKQKGLTNIRFVLTLKEDEYREKIGAIPEIYNTGPLRPEECPSLYQECDIMFLPTLAECFSASYPEAMISEKPIITTDLGFARSICGDAALYYEPMNADAATEVIIRLINSPDLQKDLIKKGLTQLKKFDTAAERAEKYLKICESIAHQKQKPRDFISAAVI